MSENTEKKGKKKKVFVPLCAVLVSHGGLSPNWVTSARKRDFTPV